MRVALPLIAALAGALAAFACSSSDDKTATAADAGLDSATGTTGSGDDDSGGGDDDDAAATCSGGHGLDCSAQKAHAAEAMCSKFDGTSYAADCQAQNCDVPLDCQDELKALGDCFLTEPAACTADGAIDDETPTACKDAEKALVACVTGK